MHFKHIDVTKWNRREYYEHYLHNIPCTYSMTLNLDLTALLTELKQRKLKLYPTMIFLLAKTVNKHDEFRTSIDENGQVGIFDKLHPSYTVLHKEGGTFTNIWTEYSPIFTEFYEKYVDDVNQYSATKSFMGKPKIPVNVFNISSIPWVSFTGFNLNLPKTTEYLLPIFTMGKYFTQNGKIELPIAIQAHHAVCDGLHLARFIQDLQVAMNTLFELDFSH